MHDHCCAFPDFPLCRGTWVVPAVYAILKLERATSLELATYSLGSCWFSHSTKARRDFNAAVQYNWLRLEPTATKCGAAKVGCRIVAH